MSMVDASPFTGPLIAPGNVVRFHTVPAGDELPLQDWYPWPEGRAWLRCMMVTTLDGGARGHDGTSSGLSCEADQRIFHETRRLADAVLVGAGTIRAESYEPIGLGADADERVARGQTAAPIIVIVSSSLNLPWDSPLFVSSAVPPIVVTAESARGADLARARASCEVVVLPGNRVEPAALVSHLGYRGLTHVVCEGGPHLLSQLISTGLVDEADITIAPMQVGGGQVLTGRAIPEPRTLSLVSVIEQSGWLFTRYCRPSAHDAWGP